MPKINQITSTLVELLSWRAQQQPTQPAYTFLLDGETEEGSVTYKALDEQARAIAAQLQQHNQDANHILLLYPPGLAYIAAFFGCLYAGKVAVPAYPPDPTRLQQTLPRLQKLIADAQIDIVLTETPSLEMASLLFEQAPYLKALHWLPTDKILNQLAQEWHVPQIDENSLAFLQYTSGSTSSPKGVMLTHGNLLHNSAHIQRAFDHTPESRGVIWLPPYHDMGLIGGILQPLYVGFPVILMSPLDFLQRPFRWLQAISRFQATTSGGPNFSYDLCVKKITAEEQDALDLSCWQVAFNGAEPIRPETLERFSATFKSCGFRRKAFYPCYGLAESTLIVTGGQVTLPPVIKTFQQAALQQHQAIASNLSEETGRQLVSSGTSLPDQQIAIVNPESLLACSSGQIGEIWVSGKSVAAGYFQQPTATRKTFNAYLVDSSKGPFLRTGDLGFLHDGDLFVTGRLKDLIIIRGRNYHPQDIELTVEQSHPGLRPGCGAAFAIEEGEERLIVVQEVRPHQMGSTAKIIDMIRQAIAREHALQAYEIILVEARSVPKTSSGKIQRFACREAYLAGELSIIERSIRQQTPELNDQELDEPSFIQKTLSIISDPLERQQLLLLYLQEQVKQAVQLSDVDITEPLSHLGIDSLTAVELQHRIERDLAISVPFVNFLEGMNTTQLAEQIIKSSTLMPPAISQDKFSMATNHFPLSYGQQALWFLHQFAPESPAYNIFFALEIRSKLDIQAFQHAFQRLIDRHPVLRTTYTLIEGEIWQHIHDHMKLFFKEIDATSWDQTYLNQMLAEEAHQPFDLETGPISRVHLYKRSEACFVLLFNVHHIAADFWSLVVLLDELQTLYVASKNGRSAKLPRLNRQYADYVQWQQKRLKDSRLEPQWRYWQQQLKGELPSLKLPHDYPRPPVQTYRGASHAIKLNKDLTQKIKSLAKAHGVTLYMMLLAAFQLMLHRYTGQKDILVGSPVFGRNRTRFENVVGYFVNTIVLRTHFTDNITFAELLTEVRQTVLAAFKHQDYPFSLLVERLQADRNPAYSPIFQTMFVLQKPHRLPEFAEFVLGESGTSADLGDLQLNSIALEQRIAQFDLTLMMVDTKEGLSSSFQYNTDLFDSTTIARLAEHFENLLTNIVAESTRPIASLSLLSAQKHQQLLEKWSQTEAVPLPPLCLHQRFEQQVARRPQAIALSCEDQRLSYANLNQRANQLAYTLRSLGVGPNILVGLYLERSLDLVVALLGILKAGGAYVPLDPDSPPERLAFIIADAQMPVLVTQTNLADRLPPTTITCLCLDNGSLAHQPDHNLPAVVSLDNLAYLLYTSGSTGQPKGVLVNHRHVARLFAATESWFGFDAHDVWTLFHSIAFDFSVWELWGALLYGGRLVIVPYWISRSPEAFYDLLVQNQVTVLNQTPSAFYPLMRAEAALEQPRPLTLRYVIFGGEALSLPALQLWWQRHGDQQPQLVNMYGITETTVHVTYRPLSLADSAAPYGSVIGQPIPDLQLYILDAHQQVCPPGVVGEIYVGGAGVACGYLNRPQLTQARFVPNPFSPDSDARLYRSGDLARYLPHGDIEYIGRRDFQVKIRGVRIELGEIEVALNQHPEVIETVILAREDELGHNYLVAYLVATSQAAITVSELRQYLKRKLPDTLIPTSFVFLKEMPLSANGKIDRSQLPKPEKERPELTIQFIPPRTTVEKIIADAWKKVLGLSQIGIDDNFFDLGGDSIRSIRILALAQEKGIRFSVQQIFQYQTIRHLALEAELIDVAEENKGKKQPFALISEADRQNLPPNVIDAFPLSMLQSGFVFHSNYDESYECYVTSFHIAAPLDIQKLEIAVRLLTHNHDMLRTSFDIGSYSESLQIVYAQIDTSLAVYDLRHLPAETQAEEIAAWIESEKKRAFDWREPPLFQVHVHRRSNTTFQFTLSEPYFDGWSVASFITELFNTYIALLKDETLITPPIRASYRDFVALERAAIESEATQHYWRQNLQNCTHTTLPRWPTSLQDDEPAHIRCLFSIPDPVLEKLKDLALNLGVPIKSVLLAAHLKVVSLITGQNDIITGLITNGRPEKQDGDRLLGVFLNTVPVRQVVQGGTWHDLVQQAFQAECELLPHRRYPLAELQKQQGGQPLFEIAFNFTHFHILDNLQQHDELIVLDISASDQTYFPLAVYFNLDLSSSNLRVALDCNGLEAPQIEAIKSYYINTLTLMAEAPETRHETAVLTLPEERSLLAILNTTQSDLPAYPMLTMMFEEQVKITPDAIATVFDEIQVTYADLNRRANQLAHYLRRLGVGSEVLVGIYMERSIEMLVAFLGVLKAGGAYVPLDSNFPRARLAFMIDDSKMSLILAQSHLQDELVEYREKTIYPDQLGETIALESINDIEINPSPDNLAYVIYTSGSTGKPKGVQITNRSLINFMVGIKQAVMTEKQDVFLAVTTLSFDIAALELFLPLIEGLRLIVANNNIVADGVGLANTMLDQNVTVMQATPATWRLLIESGWEGQKDLRILCGGEAFPRHLANKLAEDNSSLQNMYGPTETTIWSTTSKIVSQPGPISIGKPIANTQIYLVDSHLNPVPAAVPGEMYIGGVGLSRGYYKRPKLTAEKFVPNPFSQEPGARLYRVGDLARFLTGGEIEFLRRIDNQVKIHGFRIELGEIEAVLRQHDAVKEAVVLSNEVTNVPDDKRLIAYLTTSQTTIPTKDELRRFLRIALPEYMIPADFIALDSLPLTPNGKLDRKSLLKLDGLLLQSEIAYTAPRTEAENTVATIWQEVLGKEKISIHDNFFDLGGHSLLLARLHNKLQIAFGKDIPLIQLFKYSTVKSTANYLSSLHKEEFSMVQNQARAETRKRAMRRQRHLRNSKISKN